MLLELIEDLYAHTIMTIDDILFIAKSNCITIDASVEDKLTATLDNESITFDVTIDNVLVYIFDIE